jgi:hypothetical protein
VAQGHAVKSVTLEIAGLLRRPEGWSKGALTLEAPKATTVAGALRLAGYSDLEASRIQVLSEGKTLSKDALPEDGTKLTLYLPVGGG